jgi:hypothetical protein
MKIDIACGSCPWTGAVKEELAGKTGKCPKCGEKIRIPELEPPEFVDELSDDDLVDDDDDDSAKPIAMKKEPEAPKPVAKSKPSGFSSGVEPRRPSGFDDGTEPRKKRKSKIRRSEESSRPRIAIDISPGVYVGAFMILGGVVLFFIIYMNDRISFYPIILAICGFFKIVQSLMGGDDD